MRTTVFGTTLALAVLAALPSRAADPGGTPLTLRVGDSIAIGPAPVRQVICDDGSVVEVIETAQGPALRGRGPGSTVCSFVDALSFRQVYRVTVVEPPGGGTPDDGSKDDAPHRTRGS
jgi:hypothetical protein